MDLPDEPYAPDVLFQKDFYREHPSVAARSDAEVASYRSRRAIEVTGAGAPRPCAAFEEASFPSYVLEELLKSGFKEPTAIQARHPYSLLLYSPVCRPSYHFNISLQAF